MSDGFKPLVVFFSRPGWNMDYDSERYLHTGHTEVLAKKIADVLQADTFKIDPVLGYPGNTENCKNRHHLELAANLYPPFKDPIPNLDEYDLLLIGFPLWLQTVPRIVQNFIRNAPIGDKIILPFYTYSVQADGELEPIFNELAPEATLGAPLTLRGETVEDEANLEEIKNWLRSAELID